jgi:hypothetical protein
MVNTSVMNLADSGSGQNLVERALAVRTGAQSSESLDFSDAAGEFMRLAFDATLGISDVLSVSGSFGVAAMGLRSATLDNGNRRSLRLHPGIAQPVFANAKITQRVLVTALAGSNHLQLLRGLGRLGASALDDFTIGGNEQIKLAGERGEIGRKSAFNPVALAAPDRRHFALQTAQGRQTKAHLRHGRGGLSPVGLPHRRIHIAPFGAF